MLSSCCSVANLCPTLCDSMGCSMPDFPVCHYLPEFAQTHVQWVNNTIQPSHPLLPASLLSLNLPQHQALSNELALRIRWPKYWRFSFSISPSKEYSGLISFRMDWFNLLAVQILLKSLQQNHNSKASILWHSTFFMVQLSHPYMTTGKTIALALCIFLSAKWCPYFFIHWFVIAFLPRSKCLLISWLQSPSTVVLEPRKIKSVTVSTFSPSICH